MTFIKELLSTKNLFPRKSKRLIRLRPKQGITKTSGRHAELQLLPQPLKQPSTSTDEGRFSIWVTGHSGQILAHLYGDKWEHQDDTVITPLNSIHFTVLIL